MTRLSPCPDTVSAIPTTPFEHPPLTRLIIVTKSSDPERRMLAPRTLRLQPTRTPD